MSMEAVLQYFMAHNQAITNWLFVAVLILSAAVAVFTLVRPREAAGSSGTSTKDIEVALRKVMDEKITTGAPVQTQAAVGPVVASDSEDLVPAQMAQALQLELETKKAEVIRLHADLEAKEKSLSELQASSLSASQNTSDNSNLKTRVSELEAKLAEYAIIEDDIADLCLYKEENTRLKEELEQIKSGTTPAIGQAIPPAPEPVAVSTPEPAAVASETPSFELKQDAIDDLEAEFAAAVAAQKEEESVQAAAASTPEVPREVVAPETPEAAQEDPLADDLDTEKMMAEMASLNDLPEEDQAGVARILEDQSDTDKMAEEASALNDVEPMKKGS